MNRAARGLGLLAAGLIVVAGVGWWLLGDGSAPKVEPARAGAATAAAPADALSTPASAEGTRPSPQRAEEIAAAEPATVAATATFPTAEHLSGVVVDANDRPIGGAEVSFGPLIRSAGGRGGFTIMKFGTGNAMPDPVRTRTAQDGTFRLASVPRLEGLRLRVDHPDYVVYTRDDVIVPSRGLELGRIKLQVGASVAGHVFGPGGSPLAGAEVSLRDAGDGGMQGVRIYGFDFGAYGDRTAKSDAEGRFRLAGMPAGKVTVVATATELCEAVSDPIELVAMQEVGNVVLHLERGHSLTGRVLDPDGAPVAGASIYVDAGSAFKGMRGMHFDADATTGADGRFEVKALEPGVYEVSADAEGFAPGSVTNVDTARAPPLEIRLAPGTFVAGSVRVKGTGEPVPDVKVQLTPYWGENAPFMPGFETPDANNRATAAGEFRIDDVEPGQYRVAARGPGTTRVFSAPITIADGKSVDGLVIEVERGAILAGRILDAASGAPIEGADVSCFVESPPPAPKAGQHEIQIVSRIGAGSRIGFDPTRRNVGRAKTDADGRYAIEHLGAGNYKIDASHGDYATARSDEIAVAAAEHKEGADLRLGPGGTIEGTVLGIDGQPRAGDRIDVESKSIPGVSRSAVTDASGWYRIERVPAGEALATRSEGAETASRGNVIAFKATAVLAGGGSEPEPGKRIVVEEGETLRLDFSQLEKPYVEGVVTSADGPIAGAIVTAMAASGGPMIVGPMFGGQKQVTTGADGRYRLADLDPGSWRITARHPMGIVPTNASITLEAGSPARQDFFLDGGVVEGDVVALKDGERLEGATVTLERVKAEEGVEAVTGHMEFVMAVPGGRGRRTSRAIRFGGGSETRVTTDRDGHFRIPWVPAGSYRVSVDRAGFLSAQSPELEVAQNGHVEGVKVELPPAAQLAVTLRSKGTGEPIAHAPVQLESADGEFQANVTDAEGVARFETLKPGTWNVTGKRSWQDAGEKQSVECAAERTAEITIDL